MGDGLKEERFTSRFAAVLVIVMTSLGLGNIWRFPYLCAKYGGASFVVVYIIAIIFVVNIGNMCEACMGKFSRRGVVGAFTSIGRRRIWRICGWLILWLNAVVMIYYNNIVGWVTRYFFTSFSGAVWKAPSPEAFFKSFINTPEVFLYALLINVIVFGVLWFGLKGGIERAANIIGPLLFAVMIFLIIRALTLPGIERGLEYYLAPDWSYLLKYETWMQAIGQALWSGCFGWGIMITMGSYMLKGDDMGTSFTVTGLLDGAISWLVGFAIIPATVALGVPLDSGSSLSFLVLPRMFHDMPLGQISMIMFYGSLMLAGLAASIGCVEAIIKPLIEEWRINRKVIIAGAFVIWVLASLPSALNKDVLDWIDLTIGTFAILLGGFFILIFVGWAWGAQRVRETVLNVEGGIKFGPWWDYLVKFVAPGLIAFASFGFFKAWLFPYVPWYISWFILGAILTLNGFILYNALMYRVPSSSNSDNCVGKSG